MTPSEARRAPLLQFLSPGLIHGLGNSIFTIQGNAQVMGVTGESCVRERDAILTATERAQRTLDIFRCLTDEAGEGDVGQAGVLLRRMCEITRVPLRDRGIRLQVDQSSTSTPIVVQAGAFTRAFGELVRCIAAEIPTGFQGTLGVDLAVQAESEVRFHVSVESQPTFLPFPLDLDRVCAAMREFLAPEEITLAGPTEDGTLVLAVPAVRAKV